MMGAGCVLIGGVGKGRCYTGAHNCQNPNHNLKTCAFNGNYTSVKKASTHIYAMSKIYKVLFPIHFIDRVSIATSLHPGTDSINV